MTDEAIAEQRRIDARSSGGDQDLDGLSAAVLEQLKCVPDSVAEHDPHGTLLSLASKVAASRASNSQTVLDPATQAKEQLLLRGIVQTLEPHRREILLLHVNDGLTYKQIAARLGRHPEYVIRELTRAYCTLRNESGGTNIVS